MAAQRPGLTQALGVHVSDPLLARLESAFKDTSDVYVSPGMDAPEYFAALEADIRSHVCAPFLLSAMVMPPGFPDSQVGGFVSGQCVAHNVDHWLVYQPDQDTIYCFWGSDPANLGAHGVLGSPLSCWSA